VRVGSPSRTRGTIPDRGLFGVYLVEGGGRVGELDEEMVYEARAGQTFLLGASTWRIEEITRDRVLVSPAPGIPGLVPFWKGEGVGRPFELGQAIGRTARELVGLDDERAIGKLTSRHSWTSARPVNLLTYLREQEEATRAIPSDRTVVVERFRDEIGDWRLCILTPFGGRVHAPWSLALAAAYGSRLGLEVNAIWSDDGIALHLPDADAPPPLDDILVDPASWRRSSSPSWRERRSSGPAFARTPRARSSSRAAGPAAHAPLAAAPQGPGASAGRPPLRRLPGHPRDLP
jgi:ATP-dependent Lhr-like helicase